MLDPTTTPSFLTPTEVAKLLRVSRSHVQNLQKSGALPSLRIGERRFVIRRVDLDRYLEQSFVQTNGKRKAASHA